MSAAPVPTSRMVERPRRRPTSAAIARWLSRVPPVQAVQPGEVAEVAARARARRRAVRRGAPGRRSADPRREGSRSPAVAPAPVGCQECHPRRMSEPRHRIVVAGESLIDRIVRPDGGVEEVRAAARSRPPERWPGSGSRCRSSAGCRRTRPAGGCAPRWLPMAWTSPSRSRATRRRSLGRRGARRGRRRDLPVRAGGLGGREPATGGSRRRPATGHRRPPRRHARARPRAGRRDDRGPGRNRGAGRPRRGRPEHPAGGDRRRSRLPGAPRRGCSLAPTSSGRAATTSPGSRRIDRSRRRRPGSWAPVRPCCCSPTAPDRSGS